MNEILQQVAAIGLVPVIKIEDLEKAVPLAKALCKGGLPCAEITFRAAGADKAIKAITEAIPEMLVGAGTVLTIEQVDSAIAAGAKFIVSPGLNPKIVKYCVEKGYPVVPGCANPSDIEAAIELGLDTVKFFPAEAAGGIKMIKAMSAPYGNMKFMPTGGINAKNLNDYLSFNKIIACGGSWMVPTDLLDAGDFDGITALAREAVHTMLGFELAHIGVNSNEETNNCAEAFANIFGAPIKEGNSSVFVGSVVELMKRNGRGQNGHIAIRTNSVVRAVNYLKNCCGITFDESSAKYNDKGVMTVIFMEKEIGGFAIHLIQK